MVTLLQRWNLTILPPQPTELYLKQASHGGVEYNVLDCDILLNEFEINSRYYIPLWTNTLGKGMNPLSP